MDCDIKSLSKEELSLLLESIPRRFYLSFGKPNQIITSGFRDINKIPDTMFYNNIKKLIDKDYSFATSFTKFLTAERDNILEEVRQYEEEQGYDHISAYGKVIEKNFSKKSRAIYLKLFGENEADAKAILRSIEAEAALESKIKAIVTPMIPGPDIRIDGIKEEVARLKVELAKLTKVQKEANDINEKSHRQIRSDFAEDLKTSIAKIQNEISGLSASIKKSIPEIEKRLVAKQKAEPALSVKELTAICEALESLSKRVVDLEDAFVEIPSQAPAIPANSAPSPFEILTVSSTLDVYITDEEYIGENIIDVAEGRIPNASADLYKSALLEFIYSDRPIIAAGNAAKHLAEEISGVLTKQTYYRIKLIVRNFEYTDLTNAIKRVCKEDEASVVLIEGVLGKADLTDLFKRLKGIAPFSKFVFSLPETRFVKFLDPSVFAECLYFGGVFKDKPSTCAYQTRVSDQPEIDVPEFDELKDSLGIRNGFAFKLHQRDWSGVVAYCLLPYLVDYGQITLSDALARILDLDLRRKCKEALDAQL